MQRFIAVAGTYNDHLLYFQPEELNLSKGTKVRITGGDFEGQEGVFLKVKGARDQSCSDCYTRYHCRCHGDHPSRPH